MNEQTFEDSYKKIIEEKHETSKARRTDYADRNEKLRLFIKRFFLPKIETIRETPYVFA